MCGALAAPRPRPTPTTPENVHRNVMSPSRSSAAAILCCSGKGSAAPGLARHSSSAALSACRGRTVLG
jgi:hypothetical protein